MSAPPSFTEKEKDVDVILVGTGLPNCLLAAALGRAGKKVLHLDPNAVYGGAWATLNLTQLEEWAKTKTISIYSHAGTTSGAASASASIEQNGARRAEDVDKKRNEDLHEQRENNDEIITQEEPIRNFASFFSHSAYRYDVSYLPAAPAKDSSAATAVEAGASGNNDINTSAAAGDVEGFSTSTKQIVPGPVISPSNTTRSSVSTRTPSSEKILTEMSKDAGTKTTTRTTGSRFSSTAADGGASTDIKVVDEGNGEDLQDELKRNQTGGATTVELLVEKNKDDKKQVEEKLWHDNPNLRRQKLLHTNHKLCRNRKFTWNPFGHFYSIEGKKNKNSKNGTTASCEGQQKQPEQTTSSSTSSAADGVGNNTKIGEADVGFENELEKLRKLKNKFSLDLLPRCMFTNSSLVELFLQTGVSRYLEFQSLNDGNLSLFDDKETTSSAGRETSSKGAGGKTKTTRSSTAISSASSSSSSKFLKVPCSKSGIFQSKNLSLAEKRQLMKFLNQTSAVALNSEAKLGHDKHEKNSIFNTLAPAGGRGPSSSRGGDRSTTTSSAVDQDVDLLSCETVLFADFLKEANLSQRLQDYVLHVVCMEQEKEKSKPASLLSKEEGLVKMTQFASAMTRFATDSPFLYPMYGTSDVGQAWTRMGALHEVVFALECGVEEILFDVEHQSEEGDDDKDELHADVLLAGRGAGGTIRNNQRTKNNSQVVRGIRASNKDFVRCREAIVLGPEYSVPMHQQKNSTAPTTTGTRDLECKKLLHPASSSSKYTLRLLWVTTGSPLLEIPGFGFCVVPQQALQIPSKSCNRNKNPIQIMQLDHRSGTVPEGYHAVHAAQVFDIVKRTATGTTAATATAEQDVVHQEINEDQHESKLLAEALENLSCEVRKLLQYSYEDVVELNGEEKPGMPKTKVLLQLTYAQRVKTTRSSTTSTDYSPSVDPDPVEVEQQAQGAMQATPRTTFANLHTDDFLPNSLFLLEDEAFTAEKLFRKIVSKKACEFLEKPKYVQEREEEMMKESEAQYKDIIGDMEETVLKKEVHENVIERETEQTSAGADHMTVGLDAVGAGASSGVSAGSAAVAASADAARGE
ncbi:unnamed protein product [Amoebophrya sp. A120]|nr:unnamed protein product [Amoebophrya sp. A120]|eukprot:GSA120T00008605001.1